MSVEGKVKRLIKEYYVDCRKLRIQREILKILETKVAKAKADIKASNVFMHTDIRAMRFDTVNVQGGMPKSQIDIELEKSSDRLLTIYSQEFQAATEVKEKIQEYEDRTMEIGLIINLFDDVEKEILLMRFRDAKSFKVIGINIRMSESTVKRQIDRMIITIAEDLGIKEEDAS